MRNKTNFNYFLNNLIKSNLTLPVAISVSRQKDVHVSVSVAGQDSVSRILNFFQDEEVSVIDFFRTQFTVSKKPLAK